MLTAQASDTVEGDQNVEEQRQDAEVLFYTRRAVGSRCGHRDSCIHAHPLPAQDKANGTRMVACVSSLKQIWAMMMCALLLSIPSRAAGDEPVPDWLKKPVYDRSVEVEGTRLNLATEKALENATVSDPDIFSVSLSDTETYRSDRSLAVRIDSTLDDLNRTGTFQTPHSVEMWIPLPDGLDLTPYTNLYFRCKLTGSRAAYLAVSLVNLPVSWGKSSPEIRRKISGVGTQVPIDRGGWSQYRMILTGRGKQTLAACRYLFLRTQIVGHMPDEPAVSHIYLDGFVLTDDPIRHDRGWQVDPEAISVPQTGYGVHHPKQALLSGKSPAESFVVRHQATGEMAFEGKVETVTSQVGVTKVLDFTPLSRPGTYQVQAGGVRSLPFAIAPDAHAPCISLLGDWIFNMRCGARTAYHEPCHLDDAWYYPEAPNGGEAKGEPVHVNCAGGWHDAGDPRCYYGLYAANLPSSAVAIWDAGWRRDRDGDGVDDSLDKALWGVRHYLRIRDAEGRMFASIWHERGDFRRGCYWTDNVVGNHDDRRVVHHGWGNTSFANAVTSVALFCRRFGDQYPELKGELLAAVEPRWSYWFDKETGTVKDMKTYQNWTRPIKGYTVRNMAIYGRAALQLHLATNGRNPQYLDFARFCADKLLGVQRKAFFGEERMCGEIFSFKRPLQDRYLPHLFLAELVTELPGDPDWPRWRAALVLAARWWMKPSRALLAPFSLPSYQLDGKDFDTNCFGTVLARRGTKPRTVLVPDAHGHTLGDTAFVMSTVARVLGDLELQHLARRQVDWVTGFNPFGVSYICGFGEDCLSQMYSFTQGRMVGCVGTNFGMGKYMALPRTRRGIPSVNRPVGPEPHTTVGERLLRAMVSVSAPTRFDLTLVKGDAAWDQEVTLVWPVTGETVWRGRPQPDGALATVTVPGGTGYQLGTGGIRFRLAAFSGGYVNRTIDLNQLVQVVVDAPPEVTAGEPFRVAVEAKNSGLAEATVKVTVHAANATPSTQQFELSIPAGGALTKEIALAAGSGRQPYVVMAIPDDHFDECVDATGAVIPAAK